MHGRAGRARPHANPMMRILFGQDAARRLSVNDTEF